MNRNLLEQLAEIDPHPVDADPPIGAVTAAAVLHEIEWRSDMQTQQKPTVDSPRRRQGAWVAVAAFAVVIIVGIVASLAMRGEGGEPADDDLIVTTTLDSLPPTTAQQPAPVTSAATATEVLDAWNSSNYEAFAGLFAEGATYDAYPIATDDVRRDIEFWMTLGSKVEVGECTDDLTDGRVTCSIEGSDALSGPAGYSWAASVELDFVDGELAAFEWWPSDYGTIDFAIEMVDWLRLNHNDAYVATLNAGGCDDEKLYSCYGRMWMSSADGAETLLEYRDEYVESLG